MRILFVTHYFPPEIGAPQARLSEFARFWAEMGEDVTVLTGVPNHPTGVVPPEYRRMVRRQEEVDGYRVLRTWLYATRNAGVLRKTLSHISFMFSSVLLGTRKSGPADVVVASSPTFFSALGAWAIARLKRARLVVEVRDLWPAIFVELGVLRNRFVIRILERIELWLYSAADAVVVVSEGFKADLVRRGVSPEKVTTIFNGVDLEQFAVDEPADPQIRAELGASQDDTLVLYIGAHGISHGLETIADAAKGLDDEQIVFAFVGEGAAKEKLVRRVAEIGATNVVTRPGVTRDEVPRIIASADICLVPLRDIPLFESFIPSKMFEFLACGKAVVGSLSGEAATILEQAGAVVVEPEQPLALAAAVASLAEQPDRREAMGRVGRAHVESHFDRRHLADRYLKLLHSLA